MKIKRFTAANMQAGLKTISETLGPEAVILSNKRLAKGLEIVAGVDETEYQRYLETQPEPESDSDIIKANPSTPLDKETMQELFSVMSDKNKQAFSSLDEQPVPANVMQAPEAVKRVRESLGKDTAEVKPSKPEAPGMDQAMVELLRQEIDGLKDLLKEQTEQLKTPTVSVDMSPQYERLESRLLTLGFTSPFIRRILLNYDREDSIEHNWRKVMNRFASALPMPLYEPLSTGGVFAFTGPTGAGKTTTIAKLAAHAVKDYGMDAVSVVSLDWFQVGGQEILRSVSNILDIDFHALNEDDSLADVLDQLAHKKLVLIDTSGSSEALKHWNSLLSDKSLANRVQTILVMPATMIPSAVSQFVQQHRTAAFSGVVLSKLDESSCFGGVLEPVMKHRWPLWYCTTGQNIPQDIEMANARQLTQRLVNSLKTEQALLASAS